MREEENGTPILLPQIRVHLQYLGHPIANDFLYLYPGPLPEEARKKEEAAAKREETASAKKAGAWGGLPSVPGR